MARPPRNNVDYFPFLCKVGKPMRFIEQKYGNDGFVVWMKILRELAITNFHHISLANHFDMDYLASECKVDIDRLQAIISDLCKIEEFDIDIWAQYRAIYSQKFIDNIQDAYKKRENKCIDRNGVLNILKNGKDQHKPEKNRQTALSVHTFKEPTVKNVALDGNKSQQTVFEYYKEQLKSIENLEHVARTTKLDKQTVVNKLNIFIANAISVDYPNAREMKNHFVSWLRKNINEVESPTKTTVSFGKPTN